MRSCVYGWSILTISVFQGQWLLSTGYCTYFICLRYLLENWIALIIMSKPRRQVREIKKTFVLKWNKWLANLIQSKAIRDSHFFKIINKNRNICPTWEYLSSFLGPLEVVRSSLRFSCPLSFFQMDAVFKKKITMKQWFVKPSVQEKSILMNSNQWVST